MNDEILGTLLGGFQVLVGCEMVHLVDEAERTEDDVKREMLFDLVADLRGYILELENTINNITE